MIKESELEGVREGEEESEEEEIGGREGNGSATTRNAHTLIYRSAFDVKMSGCFSNSARYIVLST